jgi:hypothetical protein
VVVGPFHSVKVMRSGQPMITTQDVKRKESSVHFGRITGEYSGDSGQMCEVDFMVKLLRACVWMPWRK